jgi:hypothetical protein
MSRIKGTAQTITATSPAAASTVVHTAIFAGDMLSRADKLVIDAALLGGTGGTLDIYLQRKLATNTWRDWVHFPQIAAATAKKYTVTITGDGSSIVETGGGTDAAPGVALAANTAINTIPGGDVRIVFVAGGGTSAGASNSIVITPYSSRDG